MIKIKSKHSSQSISYRPDIDGLRAVAVLLVILYHANINIFPGGFIGVDVFFVISGYLITQIIVKEIKSDEFSLKNFYERRIRRIIPALYTVIVFCLCISYFLFLPQEFESFSKSVIASALSVSNILFWQETGYFDSGAELKPLLHTWSLGVEEQFYIFFPIYFLLIYKLFRKLIIPSLLVIGILSLILSIWATTNAMTANFYLAPTRAWELLMGSIIAFYPNKKALSIYVSNILGIAGLMMILLAAINYSYSTPFPGIYALLPCLGTALVIISGLEHNTIPKGILSLKILVFIGLISYSLYLWHWPIFVFLNYIYANDLPVFLSIFAIFISFIVSIFSWKYIEEPIRQKKILSGSKNIFIIFTLATVPIITIGSLIIYSKGIPNRFQNIEILHTLKQKNSNPECADIPARSYIQERCLFGDKAKDNINYLIWGDSHAHAISPAIIEAASKNSKETGALASTSGCPPLLDVELRHKSDNEKCTAINEAVFSTISPNTLVFLAARWGYYHQRSPINKEGPVWIKDRFSEERSEEENLKVLSRGFKRTIQAINDKGAKVIVIASPPEFHQDVPTRYWQFDEILTIPLSSHKKQTNDISGVLDQLIKRYGVKVIKTEDFYCDKEACHAGRDGSLYFRDNDHISPGAAKYLTPLFDCAFKDFE